LFLSSLLFLLNIGIFFKAKLLSHKNTPISFEAETFALETEAFFLEAETFVLEAEAFAFEAEAISAIEDVPSTAFVSVTT
jgi:hypothetical protein